MCWASGEPRAAAAFAEAHALWPDPLTLFWVARWESQNRDYAAALSTLGELRAAAGTLLRYHFAGFSVLGWLEEARCLRNLSRFSESLRFYKRVLDHWERDAGAYGIMRKVHEEYLTLQEGAEIHDRLLGNVRAHRNG